MAIKDVPARNDGKKNSYAVGHPLVSPAPLGVGSALHGALR